jgi:hypothetical protein
MESAAADTCPKQALKQEMILGPWWIELVLGDFSFSQRVKMIVETHSCSLSVLRTSYYVTL